MTPRPLILDTDIGTDVDDLVALSLILNSPELELIGVTTVYGDVALRARMVRKLLALRGRPDVPVAMGAAKPLLGKRDVYWEGHEGQGLLTEADFAAPLAGDHAVDFIVRTVMAHPGEITLAAIGPLTNVALAFLREPALARALAGLVIMGGVVGGAGALHLPWVEHNFRCDPEAGHIVLAAGAAPRIVPLDVTTRVRICQDDAERIRALGDPFHLAVADQILRYPAFVRRGGYTFLHDPLAVATVIEPALVTWQAVHAVVETGGEHTAGRLLAALPTAERPATAQIALDVDVERSERFIVERLLR
ncbi:MAG: nucleoside hydrolase [Anaerolineae bacterium]